MSITVIMPDGVATKPVEFYKWLAYYAADQNVWVHDNGKYTHLLKWDTVHKRHNVVVDPEASTEASLFMTTEALCHCQALVYNPAGLFIGV
jgi:hypothetical protein